MECALPRCACLPADTVLMQRVFCDNQEGVLDSSSSMRRSSRANSPMQDSQQQQRQPQEQQQQRHPLE
jgi:hypothetical protein